MKKIAFAILFLSFALKIQAQQHLLTTYGFRLGLTASPNFGFVKVDGGKGDGLSLGFSYGLIGDFNFAENYSFTTGVTITTINGKSTEVPPPSSSMPANAAYNVKYKMQYIEVPLTIKLKTTPLNGVRWYGQFGLSNDIRIGAKKDISGAGLSGNNVDATDDTHFYRAGMIIGGGGEFDLSGKTSLMLGLTLNNGFTNLSSTGTNVRNHYVGINFGVFF